MKVLTAFFRNDYGDPSRGPSGESLIYLPAFQAAGFDTVPFFFEENGFPNDLQGLQSRLLNAVEATRPEFVFFILIENEIWPETLDAIGRISTTVNWFCDDQWRFEDFTSLVAPHLGVSLTVDKYCLQKYRDKGLNSVRLVHWCPPFDLQDVPIETTEYSYEVTFVGGKNFAREWAVDMLKRNGILVECFGLGWPNGKVTFEQMKEIFLTSKINLNLSNSIPTEHSYYDFWLDQKLEANRYSLKSTLNPLRKWPLWVERNDLKRGKLLPYSSKNQEQVKGRNFEIAGCGGFQLSKMAIGLESFYDIGSEIMVYNTIDELQLLIRYYLANPDERKTMARRAFERTRGYQLKDHLKEIFEGIGYEAN